jgi:hypothetical protein
MTAPGNDFFEYIPVRYDEPYYKFREGKTIIDFIVSKCGLPKFKPELEIIFMDLDINFEQIPRLNLESRIVIFKNCDVKGDLLQAENIGLLIFDGCNFNSSISVDVSYTILEIKQSTNLSEIILGENNDSTIILVSNDLNKISSQLHLSNSDIDRKLNELHVKGNTAEVMKFEVIRCVISKLTIEDSKINEVSINSSRIDNIIIKSNKIVEPLNIIFKEGEMLVPHNQSIYVPLYPCVNSIKIHNVSAPNINLLVERYKSNEKVIVTKMELYEVNNVLINNFNFTNLELQNSNAENITFNNVDIKSLTLSKFIVKRDVIFSNVNAKYLKEIIPKKVNILKSLFGEKSKSKIDISGSLTIINNSMLGGMEVNPSFLHHFQSIEFQESSISGLKLPSFKPLSNQTIKKSKDNLGSIEFYRELQTIMLEQNNKYYATVYRALEQNLRLRERFKKLIIFNSDTLILTLNKISNNHGTQPFFALLGVFILIMMYYFALSREFSLNDCSLDALELMKSNIGYFFKPLTFISEIESVEYEFSFGFRLWDILYKFFYAYLVYQFIAAFRKFNK